METQEIEATKISAYAVPGVFTFTPQKLIEKIVCGIYNLKSEDLQQETRKREIVEARYICMSLYYHLYRRSGATLNDAALPYGKDHATVLHATKTIKNILKTQPKDRLSINYKKTFYEFAKYGTIKNQLTNYELL